MKLTDEQIAVINRYTDAYRIDREKLIGYLEKHKTIKAEVFPYCTKVSKRAWGSSKGYCMYLSDEPTYTPVDRVTFIRRIPFYFYAVSAGGDKRTGLSYIIPINQKPELTAEEFEEFYKDLEWMYYDLGIALDDIYNYLRNQLAAPRKNSDNALKASSFLDEPGLGIRQTFFQWRHYLHLCQDLHWDNYMPERFITTYNEALEAAGLEPIIYRPLKEMFGHYTIDENTFICRGNFPCDENGCPIMRWTTIRVTHPAGIEFDGEKSSCGILKIKFSPKTTVHCREFYTDDDENAAQTNEEDEGQKEPLMWRQVYAGPQTMFFNHEALKAFRIERGMTQNDVALAIETSVRTYQKWEAGVTTPDGHNLLRLMCWLNISDVQDLITYKDYPDE